MNLFKTSLWAGFSTLIKMGSNLLISKVLAVYVGPVGFAVIGQFQNIVQVAQTFSGSMIQQGIIKYTAEFHDCPQEKIKFWQAGFKLISYSSVVLGCCVMFGSHWLAINFLREPKMGYLFVALGCSLFFYAMNNFLLAILNGERDIRNYTLYNIVFSIQGLLLTVGLSILYKLPGALWSLVLNQSLVFVTFYPFIKKKLPVKIMQLWAGVDQIYFTKLLVFGCMSVISAIALPVVQIVIRTFIIHKISLEAAGYWQALTKLSDTYLTIITTTLSVYYLPRLSALQDNIALKKEIINGYKYILPATIACALIVFVLKKPIVYILLSSKFYPILPLIWIQLFGDILKILAWLLGFIMWAKADFKIFITTEILFSVNYIMLSWFGINYFGLMGVLLAFCANFFLYWLVLMFYYSIKIKTFEQG